MMYGAPERRVEDRRTWHDEANALHERLEKIEKLAEETNSCMLTHVESEKETKAALDELILLWRGSKMMVSAAKLVIPVFAALIGAVVWAREHFKW